jgi:hypothetical protein
MANEIKLGYYTGQTLTYAVYNPDGTEVTAPGTALPEIGATGYYTATNGDIAAADICIISDTNGVLFYGEYKPDVVSAGVSAEIAAVDTKIDTIDTVVDLLLVEQQRVENVYKTETAETKPRIINL